MDSSQVNLDEKLVDNEQSYQWLKFGDINPSAWGNLNPSSYCVVGRLFYGIFKLWSKLQRKNEEIISRNSLPHYKRASSFMNKREAA